LKRRLFLLNVRELTGRESGVYDPAFLARMIEVDPKGERDSGYGVPVPASEGDDSMDSLVTTEKGALKTKCHRRATL